MNNDKDNDKSVKNDTEFVEDIQNNNNDDIIDQKQKHDIDHASESSTSPSLESLTKDIATTGNISHNPLQKLTKEKLIKSVDVYVEKHGLEEHRELFHRGAILAQTNDPSHLPDEEKEAVEREETHKFSHPKTLYYMCIMGAISAATQGADETVVSGAQLWYNKQFGIDNKEWISGLVVGAPYLACAAIGCYLTEPLNRFLGRRGVIFWSCVIAAVASIWEAFTYSWVQLFLARLLLGLGIGPKSSTVPVFSAECAPAKIRGTLVMMWQMWTAFGIMMGYVACVVLMPRNGNISDHVAWRLMLGSTVIPPLFVCAQVYFVPESPRWYIKKNRHGKAFESLCRFRNTPVQAARDLFYMQTMIAIGEEMNKGRSQLLDLIIIPRNRRALWPALWNAFGQQFCGINVIAYYSSTIFVEANFSQQSALLASMGYGIVNWVFALPAALCIDTFGRRSLVLFTYPFMALFLIITGSAFYIEGTTARVGVIAFGIYMYTAWYSSGMGPIPFTYAAEVFPLQVRDLGMSLMTGVLWGFNFILALTWPALMARITPAGGFYYYAGWNVLLFCGCFLIMPETKSLTLEEIDSTFSVPTQKFIAYQFKTMPYNLKKFWLRKKDMPKPAPLYEYDYDSYHSHHSEKVTTGEQAV